MATDKPSVLSTPPLQDRFSFSNAISDYDEVSEYVTGILNITLLYRRSLMLFFFEKFTSVIIFVTLWATDLVMELNIYNQNFSVLQLEFLLFEE